MKNIIFGSIILFISCAGSKSPDESTAAPGIVNTVTLTDAQVKMRELLPARPCAKKFPLS